MNAAIIIIGSGGHAVSVANVAISCGMKVVAYVDDDKAGNQLLGLPVITKQNCFDTRSDEHFAIAIGDNSTRERVAGEFKAEVKSATFPALVHQSAVVGLNSSVGEGTVIMPQTNVGPNANVGRFCILNTSSSIDHDCQMDDFSSVAPGVVTGGNVEIGVRSAVSIGATVKHGISIGADVVIGANSYVDKAVENNVVAYGNPCKFVRKRTQGDAYLL